MWETIQLALQGLFLFGEQSAGFAARGRLRCMQGAAQRSSATQGRAVPHNRTVFGLYESL
jgi:hypothetical protein